MVWGASIVWYLFLAGLGAGAYATSVVVARTQPDAVALRRAGRIIAPAAVAVGLVLLMVDAEAGFKNPLRFFYLATNFNSVMTWGVIILGAFMVANLATLAIDVLGKRVPHTLEYCGLALALATAAYTGVLLGVVQTFPLWNTPLLPVLFVVSAASTGVASVVLAGCFVGNRAKNVRLLARTRLVLPVAELVLVTLLLATVQANDAGAASAAAVLTGSYAALFWIGLVAAGLVFPAIASAIELRQGATLKTEVPATPSTKLTTAAEIGVLIGGFALRFIIVMAAVPLP